MYLNIDLATPIQSEFMLNAKAQSIITKNWPTTTVNGEEVFTNLYIYNGGVNTNVDEAKVLKLLGMDPDTLATQDWKGVKKSYIYFKYAPLAPIVMDDNAVYDRISNISKIGEVCNAHFTTVSYDEPADISVIKSDFTNGTNLNIYTYLPSDKDETAYVPSVDDPTGTEYIIDNLGNQSDSNWFVAFADVDKAMYDRSYTVGNTTISESYDGRMAFTTVIELTYALRELVSEADPAVVILLDKVVTDGVYSEEFKDYSLGDDADPLYLSIPKYGFDNDYNQVTIGYDRYLKVSAVSSMKKKNFAKFFALALGNGTELKKGPWWVKVVAAVVVIIIIIIAVIITIASLGGASGIAATGAFALIAAVASAIAITATIIVVALSLYAGWVASQGWAGDAQLIGKAIVVFSDIAKYAGYVAMITGAGALIQNGFKVALTAAEKEAAKKAGTALAANAMRDMTSTEIATQVLTWLNTGVSTVLDYKAEKDAQKTQDVQNQITAQEDIIADLTSNKSMELTQFEFESGNIYDTNAKIDSTYYSKTEGLVHDTTHKYYD